MASARSRRSSFMFSSSENCWRRFVGRRLASSHGCARSSFGGRHGSAPGRSSRGRSSRAPPRARHPAPPRQRRHGSVRRRCWAAFGRSGVRTKVPSSSDSSPAFSSSREKVWVRADDQVQRLELDGDGLGAEGVPRDDGAQARDPALQTRHGDDVSEFPSQIRPTKRAPGSRTFPSEAPRPAGPRPDRAELPGARGAARTRTRGAAPTRTRGRASSSPRAKTLRPRVGPRLLPPAGAASSRPPRLKDGTSADASHPPGSRDRRPRVHARRLSLARARARFRASGADGRRAARARRATRAKE